MSETPQPSLPPELALLVDQACNRYEAALRSGQKPDLEALVAEVPEEARAALRHELDRLQSFYGGRAGAGASSDPGAATADGGSNIVASGQRVRYFGDYELLEEIAHGGMGVGTGPGK